MEMVKKFHLVLISFLFFLLTACAHKKPTYDDINQANAAYASNMQASTSGIPSDASFREQVAGEQIMAKRTYYFDFDSNVIHEDDKPAIVANAGYLAKHKNTKILLEGHTDPRGSREYNIGLGERRAKAIGTMLSEKGVDPNQVRVVSYGAQKLAKNGYTEKDYQLDRRGILVYVNR